jgi:hypothetical protein
LLMDHHICCRSIFLWMIISSHFSFFFISVGIIFN